MPNLLPTPQIPSHHLLFKNSQCLQRLLRGFLHSITLQLLLGPPNPLPHNQLIPIVTLQDRRHHHPSHLLNRHPTNRLPIPHHFRRILYRTNANRPLFHPRMNPLLGDLVIRNLQIKQSFPLERSHRQTVTHQRQRQNFQHQDEHPFLITHQISNGNFKHPLRTLQYGIRTHHPESIAILELPHPHPKILDAQGQQRFQL